MKAGTALPEIYYGGGTGALLSMYDRFTLDGAAPGQIGHFDYHLSGDFFAGGPPRDGEYPFEATLSIQLRFYDLLGPGSWVQERTVILTGAYCDRYHWPGQTCVQGTSINFVDSLEVALLPGEYELTMGLRVFTEQGWDADFQHTARAYLDLPTGVTINSESGVLFKTATPVPEPQTWALLLAGLVLIPVAARRIDRKV